MEKQTTFSAAVKQCNCNASEEVGQELTLFKVPYSLNNQRGRTVLLLPNPRTIRRSTMQHPSAQRRVGNVSKPSERHNSRMSRMPLWQSAISAKLWSPVDFVYARRRMIHQNPESTGATRPIALSPKSAIIVSVLRRGSWSTCNNNILNPFKNPYNNSPICLYVNEKPRRWCWKPSILMGVKQMRVRSRYSDIEYYK